MSQRGGCLIRFHELRQEPGVYSRVTDGMAIRNSTLFSEVRLLCCYEGHLRNLTKDWQDNTDTSGGDVGDQGSLPSFDRDIGIPINFQEESNIVSF